MFSLDHVGLATDDAEALSTLLEAFLGGRRFKSEIVAEQGVAAHFLPAGVPDAPPPTLELLEPVEDAGGAVGRFLEKHGPGMHHLAIRVPKIEAAMEHAADLGLRVLSDTPRSGAAGKRIAFLHPKDTGGVLIELCEHTDPLPTAERVPFEHAGTRDELSVYPFGSDESPPLLLLHGAAGCTRLETLSLAHRLAPHFRVLALDFPGHGASDRFAEIDFSATLFAESVRAVFDHFALEEASVFGFSMGGNMALEFARRHPDRVRRLAVHGACIEWTEVLADRMAERLVPDTIRTQNGRAVTALEAAHADWPALFARTERFVRTLPARTEQMRAVAEAVEAPTLVSTADRDELFSLEATLALHRRLPDARLAVVPGRRHALAQVNLGTLLPPLVQHLLPHQ